jgi:hypothetical protein
MTHLLGRILQPRLAALFVGATLALYTLPGRGFGLL